MKNITHTNYHLPSLHYSKFSIRYSIFNFFSPLHPVAQSPFSLFTPSPFRFLPSIRYSIFIILYSIFFSFTLPAQQQWTEPINISNLGGYSMDPDMVIDHNGVIHVVWSYKITSTHWLIMYNYSEDDGLSWSEPLDLLQNTDLWMAQPHIACDSKNRLYLTYTHDYHGWTPEGRLIKMLTCDGHQWGEPITASEGMPGSHYNNIIIDHNDRIYVFWDHGPSGDDFYRFF